MEGIRRDQSVTHTGMLLETPREYRQPSGFTYARLIPPTVRSFAAYRGT